MKNLAVFLSALALAGVIALFVMRSSDQKPAASSKSPAKEQLTDTKGKIAYVNIDSLEAKYEYLKTKQAAFEERKNAMSAELERSQKQFQQDYMNAERKAAAGAMTEAERETTGTRLQQMQQSLQSREQALTEKLLKEQEEFNKDLQDRLDKFLAEYNKDKGFDYILSYSKAVRFIMLANDQLDITQDVIDGMNAEYNKEGGKEKADKEANKKNK